MKFRAGLSCGVALCALLAGTNGALTADFTVQSGQTVNATQQLTDPDNVGRIEAGGTISTGGSVGVLMSNIDQSVTNDGLIATSGFSAFGIFSTGTDAQIANNGDITTLGISAYGIVSQGTDAQITNSGDITTSGSGAFGILSQGANAQINNSGDITTLGTNANGIVSTGLGASIDNSGDITTSGLVASGIVSSGLGASIDNSGDITTSGVFAIGILSSGASAQIDNSGDITTSGQSANGIWSQGSNAQIDNNGDITTSGFAAHGINSFGAYAQIANSGEITTSGLGAVGILSEGDYATVTNSGRIMADLNGYAISFSQQNATLNLLAGSVIQGGIGFGNAEVSATLNIGPGLNTALSLADVPGTINTYGAPMVVQGSLVAVVDPTGFSAEDEMLTDLTRAIGGAIDGRLNGARFGYVPMTSSITAYVEPDTHAVELGYGTGSGTDASHGSGFWAAGLGSHRNQDAGGVDVGFDSRLAGLLVGYDDVMSGGTRVGGFLGASASNFETDANSQEIDADSYFGGVYAGFTGDSYFLDLAVTGGLSQQSSDRIVANNLVIGGIEHAEADYDGVFVSPSATIGTTFAMANGGTFIPSLRARYAGLFLDGYDESGSAANLSVDSRDVNVFDLRAQLAYALAPRPLDDGALHAMVRVGADATFADNEGVQAALLGEALNFDVSDDDTIRGFVGADLSFRTDGGCSFFLGAEAGYDSGDALTLDVRGGLQIPL